MKLYKEKKTFTDKTTNKVVEYWAIYLRTDKGLNIAIKGNDPTAKELLISIAEEIKK